MAIRPTSCHNKAEAQIITEKFSESSYRVLPKITMGRPKYNNELIVANAFGLLL